MPTVRHTRRALTTSDNRLSGHLRYTVTTHLNNGKQGPAEQEEIVAAFVDLTFAVDFADKFARSESSVPRNDGKVRIYEVWNDQMVKIHRAG